MTPPSTGRTLASSRPLFVAIGLLMLGNGLQGSLVGVRAELEGFPTAVIGLVMSGYYVGFLVGSTLTPRILWNVGHVRVYAGLASLASTAALIHAVFVHPVVWGLMRVVTGLCLAGLYVVAESWLNGASTNATRGKLLSIYMLVVTGGLAAGQFLLTAASPSDFQLFVLSSVLVSLAVVPISLSQSQAPSFEAPTGMPFRLIWENAPLGLAGMLVVGMANGAVLGFGAAWAVAAGMSVPRVALFMSLLLVGGVALQWPIGALSDRVSRRRVILGVTLAAAATAAVAGFLEPTGTFLLAVALVFGGLTFPMYSLCASHVNDLMPSDRLVAASAALLFVNGIGAVLGPIVASAVTDRVGGFGFWATLVAIHGALGGYAAYRLVKRRSFDLPDKGHHLTVPARSTLLGSDMLVEHDGEPE